MKPRAWPVLLVCLLLGIADSQESHQRKQPDSLPFLVPPWILHSRLKHGDVPEYPKDGREHHVEGDITIDVIVDSDGNVASAQWIDDGTSTLLSNPALEAVRKWKYQSTIVNGVPVALISWIVIRFQLADEPNIQILTRTESSTPARKAEPLKGPPKIRISSGVAESLITHKVEPDYPFEAKVRGIHGDVVVRCVIDKAGNLVVIGVLSGHPILAEETVKTIRKWKYKPYTLNGEPVEAETTVTVRFHMY